MRTPSGKRTAATLLLGGLLPFGMAHPFLDLTSSAGFDRPILDAWFAVRGAEPPPGDVVLVTIDEASMEFARNSLPSGTITRGEHARVLSNLVSAGARVVAFDATLEQPDSAEREEAMQSALRAAGKVAFNCYFAPLRKGTVETLAYHGPPAEYSPHALPGLASVEVDPDHILRTVRLQSQIEGVDHPSFALVVASLALGKAPEEVLRRIPSRYFSDAARSRLRVDFQGPAGTFPSVPFHDVLQNADATNPALFRGKIVIIGSDTLQAKSRLGTPFSRGDWTYGAEVHANIVHTILHGGVTHVPWVGRASLSLLAALLAAGLAVAEKRPVRRLLAFGAFCFVLVAGSAMLFVWATIWVPAVPALGSAALAFGGLSGLRALWASAADSRQRPMALVVVDMCGSTEISNRLGNQLATRLKNALRQIILEASEPLGLEFSKGTGDGMLLGFPTVPRASGAAREILRRVKARNERLEGNDRFHVRLAVHVGEVNVVDVRGQRDIEGDAANFVCRIEGVNRDALIEDDGGLTRALFPEADRILVSEGVREALVREGGFRIRYVGFFELKGITGRHRLFEVVQES